ncbi:YihY/virulence factor BrkB family protein [Salinifilum aidingensis]
MRLVTRTASNAWWDNIFSESAAAAFWQALSLPPLLLGLLGSLGFLSGWFGHDFVTDVQGEIIGLSGTVFSPQVVEQIIGPTVLDILTEGRGGIVSLGFVLSLFAGSSALASLVDSITLAHRQELVRNALWQRVFTLLLYLASLAAAVVGLPVLTLGPGLLPTLFPWRVQDDIAWLIQLLYYPATGIALVLVLATLYKVALPRKLPWHRGVPGALLAMLVFLCSSAGLRLYIAWVTSTGYTYGALAAPIAFLLFAFFLGFAIILGAQFNNALQEMWPARMTRRERRRWRRLEMKRLAQRIHTEQGYQSWRRTPESGSGQDETVPESGTAPGSGSGLDGEAVQEEGTEREHGADAGPQERPGDDASEPPGQHGAARGGDCAGPDHGGPRPEQDASAPRLVRRGGADG